jgi:hypothetical protein
MNSERKTLQYVLCTASALVPEDRAPMTDGNWEYERSVDGAHRLYLAIFNPKWLSFRSVRQTLKSTTELFSIFSGIGINFTNRDEFCDLINNDFRVTHQRVGFLKQEREMNFEDVKGWNFDGFRIREYERTLPYS